MPKGSQRGSIEAHHGKWRIQFHVPGRNRPVRESTGLPATEKMRKAALAMLRKRVAEVEAGVFSERSVRTFGDYAEAWIKALEGSASRGGDTFKRSSIVRYERLLRRWRLALGSASLASLTLTDIEAAKRSVLSGVAASTATSLMIVAKKMLRQAAKDGLIASSVVESMKTPPPPRRRVLPEEVWSQEEAARLPGEADTIDPEFGRYVRIALFTGMRNGEIRGLALENVDLSERVLRVRMTATEDYLEGDDPVTAPKTTDSVRDVDVPAALLPTLREQIRHAMAKGSPWLFPSHLDASKPMPYWRLRAWNNRLGTAMGRRLPPHRTRHTFASLMLVSGEDLGAVAEMMGDTPMTVHRHYAAWNDREAKRRRAERAAALYDSSPIQPPNSGTGG